MTSHETATASQQAVDTVRATWAAGEQPIDQRRWLLLTTTGAATGEQRTTPVSYLPDSMQRSLLVAVPDSSGDLPDWYRDVVAKPDVTVEYEPFFYQAQAIVLDGDERQHALARAVEADPVLSDQAAAGGVSVVALDLREGGPTPRVSTLGEGIRVTHRMYRRELALIRAEVAATGTSVGVQLRVNCLSVCQGIRSHHQGEDRRIFPLAEELRPELAAVVTELSAMHVVIDGILDDLGRAVGDEDSSTADVLAEVERLTAELEAHLSYEERVLVPALDEVQLPL